jgi:hypothetical protein
MIKNFLEKFNDSPLCKVEWRLPPHSHEENVQKVILTPINSIGGFPNIDNKEQCVNFFRNGEVAEVASNT